MNTRSLRADKIGTKQNFRSLVSFRADAYDFPVRQAIILRRRRALSIRVESDATANLFNLTDNFSFRWGLETTPAQHRKVYVTYWVTQIRHFAPNNLPSAAE
jgi:hypothetical protein